MDTVRKEHSKADDGAYNRKFEMQDAAAGIDEEVAARKKAREVLAARIAALPKPGSNETLHEADFERRDMEMRLHD